ncbi:GPP34 family phosphoprotein [Actinoplanes sp. NBRC 103695]|uniref:GOLPH3/VPS74 family protein n=1 Tax=Actinoplanes sp. NBRC 103695 TaxID=3032202 RepID=UPI00255783B5|nr:GPP34 family phosphoprotein [Actinoplanes sp. NBRC 103695]
MHQTRLNPAAVLPLHAELYLLAHDDDSGKPLINEQSLAIGLAGALLLELWFAGHVYIGSAFDYKQRQWRPESGRLAVARPGPTGSPLRDSALAAVERTVRIQTSGDQVRAWLRGFAASDLCERVQANMITVGLLRRTQVRRYGGLVKTETHLPVHEGYAVRARAHVRDAVAYYERQGRHQAAPDNQTVALCGLTAALELAEFIYDGSRSTRELSEWLRYVVDEHDEATIRAVVTAVDAGRGDLAVAAM